jgi:hypothetical protein
MDELRRLAPVQNGGRAAQNIARVCREVLASSRPSSVESVPAPKLVAARAAYA